MNVKLDSTYSTLVSESITWIPIDADTPIGVKCLVIDAKQGIAYLREYRCDHGWTHYFPLPTFKGKE